MKLNLFKSYWRHDGTLVGHDCFVLYKNLSDSSTWSNVLKLWVLKLWTVESFSSSSTDVLKLKRIYIACVLNCLILQSEVSQC